MHGGDAPCAALIVKKIFSSVPRFCLPPLFLDDVAVKMRMEVESEVHISQLVHPYLYIKQDLLSNKDIPVFSCPTEII